MTSMTASNSRVGQADPTLLHVLRQATQSHHRQIEQNARLARLLQPDLTFSEYQTILARMLGFLEPLEDAITASPEAFLFQADLGDRRKAPWLVQDLRSLGLDASRIAAIPRVSLGVLPAVATQAEAAGVLYVLEGSTLGGQLISRHLERNLNIGPEQGGRFYAGYGQENGRMWSLFRQWLGSLRLDDQQLRQATSAAAQTFESMDRWLGGEVMAHG